MAIETGLQGKPWYVGGIIGLILAGAIVFVANWQLFTPKRNEIAGLQNRRAELELKIHEGRAAAQSLEKFREEVRGLELELDKLLRILPARRNTQDLLRRIRQLTEAGNFDLLRFTPGNFRDAEFYSEWPITVVLDGTYHSLALFFERVSRFPRIINIENLRIVPYRGKRPHTINASFVAKTFIYREVAPEAPAPASQRGGPARGRK